MNRILERLRIAWAIAAKDINSAFKNKTILSLMGTVAFLIVFYKYLPRLGSDGSLMTLVVYDQGESDLAYLLEDHPEFAFYAVPEMYRLERAVGREPGLWMGIVFPADLDQTLARDESVALDGYVAHWTKKADVAQMQAFFQDQLSDAMGVPVYIQPVEEGIYPRPDWGGVGFTTSASFIIVLMLVGYTVVSHLLVDEKQTRTMDALLVSPASVGDVLMGKVIAGVVYGSAAMTVVLAFNGTVVVHWGLALLTTLIGTLFSVGIGLLLGSLFSLKQQLTLWGYLAMNLLLLPVFLVIMTDLLPEVFIDVIQWVPSVALSWIYRVSFAESIPAGPVALRLGAVLVSTVLLYCVVWLGLERSRE